MQSLDYDEHGNATWALPPGAKFCSHGLRRELFKATGYASGRGPPCDWELRGVPVLGSGGPGCFPAHFIRFEAFRASQHGRRCVHDQTQLRESTSCQVETDAFRASGARSLLDRG